ncbi:hypothetical protein ACFU7T_10080 [Streptomyces sp. NPDC057555]
MAMGVEVTIEPGTGRFDPSDQRWLDQASFQALAEGVRNRLGGDG